MLIDNNTPEVWAAREKLVRRRCKIIKSARTRNEYYRFQAYILTAATIAIDAGRIETATRWISEAHQAAKSVDVTRLVRS